jgi:hypothetical protein
MSDLALCCRNLNFAHHTALHNAKLYWNPSMHVEVLLRTSVFSMTSVTLTFDLIHACDTTSHSVNIFISLSELWPLCVTLPFAAATYILHSTLRFTMVNICAKLYWNPSMHVEVLLQTSFFSMTSVTLTFDLVQASWWWTFSYLYLNFYPYVWPCPSLQEPKFCMWHCPSKS